MSGPLRLLALPAHRAAPHRGAAVDSALRAAGNGPR